MCSTNDFRRECRTWLEDNCPTEMRTPMRGMDDECSGGRQWSFQSAAQRVWFERMVERGWTVPTWPQAYGGGGLNVEQEKILREEMARIGARLPLNNFGIIMLGPALLKFGSEAQKHAHLPPIAQGEVRWCQGFSEPGAGSDLASVSMRAEDNGDHYNVSGQKIWTSHADEADSIFCLVRTDPAAAKHKGITFLLIDMNAPGVSTRPIQLISGKSPFCETFFQDVAVPKTNVVGQVNQGWTIAKYLLTHERENIGSVPAALGNRPLVATAIDAVGLDDSGRLADPLLRAEMITTERDAWGFELTLERLRDEALSGKSIGDQSSMLKFYGSELNKRRYELMMRSVGCRGLGMDSEIAREWLRSKGNSIEGGTSEIMLTIIAKSILNLPTA